jgi:hypothetical protein
MQILLAKKHSLLSFTLGVITLLFTSLSFSYTPAGGLNYLPGRDDVGTGTINESMQGCVYRESDAGGADWTVDDCDYVGAHYACYNGSEWKVAQALGTTTNPGEPQDGNAGANIRSVNSWDPIKADSQCKSKFGPSYFFSVPVSSEEDAKLGELIGDLSAAKKRTWIYYYSNTVSIPLSANYWLGNRTEYTNLLPGGLNNTDANGGVADCILMNRDTGLWQNASCSEQHSFACYDSGAWLITSEQSEWKAGFAVCDDNYGLQSLYAVPRDVAENNEIATAPLPTGGTGVANDYNKVWLNRSDLAFEEFFISNQTRSAWWGSGQPSNLNNEDCALIDSSGNWISESCDGFDAYHACYLGSNSSGVAQWGLTKGVPGLKKSESALGFGYCKQLADNAEYLPPNTAVSNNALASLLSSGEYAWINYSDQVNEGFWSVAIQYQDFVTTSNVIDGEAEDCGYFSLETDDRRNWLAGQCYAGGASLIQGFACSNGYEWKIATQSMVGGASLKSNLWKDGFTACEAAFGKDYKYSAPSDAEQNSRLALALRLSGNTQSWMNVNDAVSEGNWVANGPVVNLSPVLALSAQREFPEKTSINLSVIATDPETNNNVGLIYQWTIIGERVGVNNTGTDTVITPILSNATASTVTIPAVDLVSDDYYLDIQLQVTDADIDAPATTTQVITIKIVSPLRAAYDFNDIVNPSLDVSGNGNDLNLDTSLVGIKARNNAVNDYFADMDSTDSFSIDGLSSSFDQIPVKDEYTLIYRFKLDTLPVSNWAGFVQKGASGSRQPALFFNKTTNKIQFNNLTMDSTEAELNLEEIRLGQWVTVAYVKNGSDTKLYIDKAELNLAFPDPAPLNVIPDTTRTLLGSSIYNTDDFIFGNVSGASEGIVGGFDDIRIYERALTAAELTTIFPDQPRGEFEFTNIQESGDENVTPAAVTEIDIPVSRLAGDDGEVYVAYNLVSGTATLDTDFRLKDDIAAPGPLRGKGVLTWGVHDAVDKNITVELIGDSLREGTESFTIELEQLATEPGLAANNTIDVNIIDKTPNPYGAIGFAPSTAVENITVDEGQAGTITVERVGSDSLGAFDVLYEVESLSASNASDFTITQAGFTPSGNSGTNVVIGSGRLSFPNNTSGTPVSRQTQNISFSTTSDLELEFDESFSVRLLAVTDPGQLTLTDPAGSAILGTANQYTQVINDISPGRISFAQTSASVDEVDQGGGSNSVFVALERLGGDDGVMCVTLDLTVSSTASPSDYAITYLNPSASGQTDVYWADKDDNNKLIQITATNDESYDPSEIIELSWARKANCNGFTTATPSVPEVTDNGSTQITINDYTTPIKLKFTETSYSVSELTSGKAITVQATQTRLVGTPTEGDFSNANRVNNNAFTVNLTRVETTAIEGTHFGDLTGLETITFAPGETEKTIIVPIVDNCVASPSLSVGFGLVAPTPNAIPLGLIDVSSASSSLAIMNDSPALSVTAGATAALTNPAVIESGKWIVTGDGTTSGGFESKNLKLYAVNNTGDGCALTHDWKYISATPSLPAPGVGNAGTDLPSNFTTFSHVPSTTTAISQSSEVDDFTLPFVVDNTVLNYQVEVKHPEKPAVIINVPVSIAANWSRLKNDRGWCTKIDGGEIGTSTACNENFIYNPTTKQIISEALIGGKYGCFEVVSGNDEDVRFRTCTTNALQQVSFTGGGQNMKASNGNDLVDTLTWFTERGLKSLSGGNAGGQSGNRRNWFWEN